MVENTKIRREQNCISVDFSYALHFIIQQSIIKKRLISAFSYIYIFTRGSEALPAKIQRFARLHPRLDTA